MSQNDSRAAAEAPADGNTRQKPRPRAPVPRLSVDKGALKALRQVAVAYSHVEREWFPTEEAYQAEIEVEQRAKEVVEALGELHIAAMSYPADRYFLPKLLVDQPDLVLNLVDTLRGKDALQVSVPGALELANIPYTGSGMLGLVIGNDRNIVKQLLDANDIPTPPFQFITRRGRRIQEDLGLPLIVKLNESGGSVGIDNAAVKETYADAEARVDELISTYRLPVIVERFVDGPEITVIVFDDGHEVHVFCAEKVFNVSPDGKHLFTSLESYKMPDPYHYKKAGKETVEAVSRVARQAFKVLHFRDYAKFDVRIDQADRTPYITDANPNTAFGPSLGLPLTEVLHLHRVKFETVLASLLSKYARQLVRTTSQTTA